MITDSIDAEKLFAELDDVWIELVQHLSPLSQQEINTVPFKDSWTAAQLITHVTKSNKAIYQGLCMEGKPAERQADEGVPGIKKMFLDFSAKYESPDFIVPEEGTYEREAVKSKLEKSIENIKDIRSKINLFEMINLPIFGDITQLELLYFVLYHTQRHVHQFKKIADALKQKKLSK